MDLANKNREVFINNKRKIEEIDRSKKAPDVIALSNILIEDADVYFETAKSKRLEADTTNSPDNKILALNQAYDYEIIAINKQSQTLEILGGSESLAQVVDSQLNNSNNQYEVPAAPVKEISENLSTEEIEPEAVSNFSNKKEVEKIEPSTNDNNSINANIETSVPVSNLMELLDNKSYDGIVYKVQIAAFKNNVPYARFNGLTPVSTEETPNGFTRIMAGVFSSLESANESKMQVKQKGFSDAFVVAYIDGKRIPIAQAKEGGVKNETSTVNKPIRFDAPIVYSNSKVGSNSEEAIVALDETRDISKKTGLFYTVQVGVYSKPIAIENKYNINNVYFEKLPNGQIRYYSGVYNDKSMAIESKVEIASKIKDAFVTAYYNGERISLSKAMEYEKK